MIEHELLFLGLLVEGPKHGYEIKRQVEEDLMPNIGLKIKSIYYPLKKMEEAGFIEKQTGREGRWPEKYVYRITPKGKKKFDHLIGQSFLAVERPFFQIDLSLYFLPWADKTMAKRRLKGRLSILRRIQQELAVLQHKSSKTPLGIILQHDLALVEAEITSIAKITQQI